MKRLLLALAILAAAPAVAQSFGPPATPAFTVVGTGERYFTLQDAVHAIGDGEGVIRIDPGRYEECALQTRGSITYQAARPGTVTLDSVVCEQKAALILRGRSARVEGIIFQNLVTPDGNGAGIRVESGNLAVRESVFRNSQSGVVAGDDPSGTVRIERSTFSGLGRCDGDMPCAHGIYVSHYGALSIANSRFERGRGGHYVKSRAPRIDVVDSSFDDSGGQATNYMIDLANGATGTIQRNAFLQGENKENRSALVAIGTEGRQNATDGLAITGNDVRLVPGLHRPTRFVVNWSGGAPRLEGNVLAAQVTEYERRP